ncbi:MAG: glycosyltransferase family 4 protein [Baekduiaceae bacterium]
MTATIGIDARAAAEVPAGRGRYVRELLRALAALPEAHEIRFELWAREIWDDPALDDRFAWKLVGLPDPFWNVAAGLRAGRSADVFLSSNSYLTAWFTSCPTAIVVYDLVPFVEGAQAQSRAARIERATIRPALRRAAALPCISEATRRDLIARFPRTAPIASTIPLAADAALAAPPSLPAGHPDLHRPYVLAVGTLEPRKNLERLVAAWLHLPAALREAHDLALVGPRGWDDGSILQAAPAAGAQLLGRVSDDELHALYAGAACFVYPSLYEGFGLPVLEAMAAGAPVVTSNVSSIPEVAGDAALLVDPHDVPAIAGAIQRVLTEPGLAEDLRARGEAQASRFSWERTARETLALLLSAARRRTRP